MIKWIALSVAISCFGCARQLPIVQRVARPAQTQGSAESEGPNWTKNQTGRLLMSQFEDCESELEETRERFASSESVRQVYGALSGVLGGAGAGVSVVAMPEAFSSSPDDWSRGLLIAGAVISLSGPVVFSILGIDEDSATPRAHFERMFLAHHRARQRFRMVISCLELIYEDPRVVRAATTEDSADLERLRQRYEATCQTLDEPIAPPDDSEEDQAPPPTIAPESPEARALAISTVGPTTHWIAITEYLDTYCHPTAPAERD